MLADWLSQRRDAIVQQWFARIVETYPADAAKFLHRRNDPFQNPVGHTILREIERLVDQLPQGVDTEAATTALENVVRIRAVQDFSPSQAVGFVFLLKGVLREQMSAEPDGSAALAEWPELESRIDDLALLAFDVYAKCRERIFEVRANEMKRASYMWQRTHPDSAEAPEDGRLTIDVDEQGNRMGGTG